MPRVLSSLHHVLQVCPLPAALLDSAGGILETNEPLCTAAGVDARAVHGRPFWTLADPSVHDELRRAFALVAAGRRSSGQWEGPLRVGTGGMRRVTMAFWSVEESPGRRVGHFLQVLDAGAGRASEPTAREASIATHAREDQTALHLALEAGHMGMWHWDAASGALDVSPEFCRLHELDATSGGLDLERCLAVLHPDDRDAVRAAVTAGLETTDAHEIEYRITRPDGEPRWLLARGSTERNARGEPVRRSGVCADVTARKQSDEELHRRHERHRAFLATSTEAIWRVELERPVPTSWPPQRQVDAVFEHAYLAECNDALARMYGFERADDLIGTRLPALLPPDDPANQEYMLRFVASGYRLISEESHEVDRHGRPKYFRNSLVGIVDHGQVLRAWGTQADITDQKAAEARLRDSEARFRLMADHAPVLIWLADTENQGTFFNQPWLEFTGAPLDAQLGTGWLGFIHPDDRAAAAARYQAHVDRREPFRLEFRLRRHDGAYRWVLDHATPLVDEAGQFSGYIGACIDISDLKAAQEREAFLAMAGKVLASSLDYPETLGTVAELATPFLADACAVDMFTDEGGVERLAVTGRDAERRARLIEAGTRWPPRLDTPGVLQEIARTGQPVLVSQVTDAMLVRAARDAEHLAVLRSLGVRSAIVAPFVARQGVFGAITLVIAESDRIYGEADLPIAEELAHRAATAIDNARLYEQAQTANSAKDDFLARLSHELRTPLNAVLGWTMMLRGVTDPARLDRGLDVIDRNTRALARIIEDLLDFSRNVRGALRMEPVPIDLRAVTREALASVEPMARHKGVALRSGAGEPVCIVGDPARLQQVAWNLLTNAIKFTPQGGLVAVEVAATPDGATLVLSDTGEGIRPELIDTIFDPFRQGERHGTMGLGLGLAIVRQIVEAHGGTVEGRSAGAGSGATFTVRLPAVPSLTTTPAGA